MQPQQNSKMAGLFARIESEWPEKNANHSHVSPRSPICSSLQSDPLCPAGQQSIEMLFISIYWKHYDQLCQQTLILSVPMPTYAAPVAVLSAAAQEASSFSTGKKTRVPCRCSLPGTRGINLGMGPKLTFLSSFQICFRSFQGMLNPKIPCDVDFLRHLGWLAIG